MQYKPRIVKGIVRNTGWPIDDCILYFTQWDYDNGEFWHLCKWEDDADNAVMQTFYQTEKEGGICLYDTLEEFQIAWKSEEWEPQGSFCLHQDQVEVIEEL